MTRMILVDRKSKELRKKSSGDEINRYSAQRVYDFQSKTG